MTIVLTYAARAEDDCPRCPDPILIGQIIHELSTGERIHERCAP